MTQSSHHNIYGYPNVGRAGLGNMLLPWARCEVFCHRHGIPMLAPQWVQPKIGPILRGERDRRFYTGLFRTDGYIGGLRRFWLLRTARRINEHQAEQYLAHPDGSRTVIEFVGWKTLFDKLADDRAYLSERLNRMLTDDIRRRIEQSDMSRTIALHVRRGDFPRTLQLGEKIPEGKMCYKLPCEWYAKVVGDIREMVGREVPACVFSDGNDEELAPLLSLPGVRRSDKQPAIVDILRMTRASMLITTGGSTFSMWAAYLSGKPSIWYATMSRRLTRDSADLEIETDLRGNLDPKWADTLREATHQDCLHQKIS